MIEKEPLPGKWILILGFLSWLVPFLASVPFFSPSGQILVQTDLFKSVMVVVGAAAGILLLVILFGKVRSRYIETGALAGIAWLLINCLFDLGILVGLFGMDLLSWTFGIAFRYLTIPVFAAGAGYIAAQAAKNRG